MNNLSNNLKNLLHNAKISENELARRTGIPQQVINRLLSGANTNPKISTLTPLANYFMVNISQLIDSNLSESRLNTNHKGWQEIPMIDFELFFHCPLEQLLKQKHRMVLVNIQASPNIFATQMQGDCMEPKFSNQTLLVFDSSKQPKNGDFALLLSENNEIMVRQIIIKDKKYYRKSVNPKHTEYKITAIKESSQYLGVLIQSRTDYNIS